jgi:hypothetical protein
MHGRSLFQVARDYFTDPKHFLERHLHPVLVWRLGAPKSKPIIESTQTLGGYGPREAPTADDPLLFDLVKGTQSAFAFGVTLGRTENNDVVLRNEDVSRFHAYVQQVKSGYAIADADSKNGTFVDGVRLHPNTPTPLRSRCKISLGALELEYYEPSAFAAYLENGEPRPTSPR